jgi:hypothetical protein
MIGLVLVGNAMGTLGKDFYPKVKSASFLNAWSKVSEFDTF